MISFEHLYFNFKPIGNDIQFLVLLYNGRVVFMEWFGL